MIVPHHGECRTPSRWRSWPGGGTGRCQRLARRDRTSRHLRNGGIACWRTRGRLARLGCPSSSGGCRKSRENCCVSSAYAVSEWSRYGRRTQSGDMDRTRFVTMSANVCSMTAASNARAVMKRMAVGRTGYDDLRCAQRSPRPPDRSGGS
jgi:hypothetical protein